MRNFKDTFETRKISFSGAFSICMDVPLHGKDTLHDAVESTFQRTPKDPSFSQTKEARTYILLKRKRKRAYDPTKIQIGPYRKKAKLLREFSTAEEIKKARRISQTFTN